MLIFTCRHLPLHHTHLKRKGWRDEAVAWTPNEGARAAASVGDPSASKPGGGGGRSGVLWAWVMAATAARSTKVVLIIITPWQY